MAFLEEVVLGPISINLPIDQVRNQINSIITEMGLEQVRRAKDQNDIEITVDYIIVDILLFRCYANKMFINMKAIDKTKTTIKIVGIPNLFQIKPSSKFIDIEELKRRIKRIKAST